MTEGWTFETWVAIFNMIGGPFLVAGFWRWISNAMAKQATATKTLDERMNEVREEQTRFRRHLDNELVAMRERRVQENAERALASIGGLLSAFRTQATRAWAAALFQPGAKEGPPDGVSFEEIMHGWNQDQVSGFAQQVNEQALFIRDNGLIERVMRFAGSVSAALLQIQTARQISETLAEQTRDRLRPFFEDDQGLKLHYSLIYVDIQVRLGVRPASDLLALERVLAETMQAPEGQSRSGGTAQQHVAADGPGGYAPGDRS